MKVTIRPKAIIRCIGCFQIAARKQLKWLLLAQKIWSKSYITNYITSPLRPDLLVSPASSVYLQQWLSSGGLF